MAIDSHVSIKLEYLYMDLGRFGNASAPTTMSVNVAMPGFSTLTVANTTGPSTPVSWTTTSGSG